jgi:glutamyl/glutaminyl-tRNA synthetase
MRVRFPPSPTGALHIGNARTALYNWLLARGSGGQLVLRIEDTDRERSTEENVGLIFDSLEWLGIDWDEGPIYQSANAERHAEVVQRLVDAGHAYRSTAGPDEVKAFKEQHGNRGFRGEDERAGATRLRVPDEGTTVVTDVIRGETEFENALLDDLVIARADGTPVYHLAVVVDDADAGITHVVRGADHYSNTPKQILIQKAMGAPTPIYAHLPLLHGPDGKKLSKRHGAASVQDLRDAGYLPEAVLNYLRALDLDDLTSRLEALTGRSGLRDAVAISQDKISTLTEFWPLTHFFFDGPVDDPAAREKVIEAPGARDALTQARAALAEVPEPWTEDRVQAALDTVAERLGVKRKQVFQPLRVALTGTTVSPGIFETVALLGRDETLARVDHALNGRKGS